MNTCDENWFNEEVKKRNNRSSHVCCQIINCLPPHTRWTASILRHIDLFLLLTVLIKLRILLKLVCREFRKIS